VDAAAEGTPEQRRTPLQLVGVFTPNLDIVANDDAAFAPNAQADRCPIIQFDVDGDPQMGNNDPAATCRLRGSLTDGAWGRAAFHGQFCLTACSVQDKTPLQVRTSSVRDVSRMNRRPRR
jgi:hypothetical protein